MAEVITQRLKDYQAKQMTHTAPEPLPEALLEANYLASPSGVMDFVKSSLAATVGLVGDIANQLEPSFEETQSHLTDEQMDTLRAMYLARRERPPEEQEFSTEWMKSLLEVERPESAASTIGEFADPSLGVKKALPMVIGAGWMIARKGVGSLAHAGITNASDTFKRAVALQAENKTPAEIYRETNWFYDEGKSNEWLYDFPHWNAKINTAYLKTRAEKAILDGVPNNVPIELALTDVYDYPELYVAFPELKNVKIEWLPGDDEGGMSFLRNLIEIQSTTNRGFKSTLDHEIQHFIQKYENLPGGSEPVMVLSKDPRTKVEVRFNIPKAVKDTVTDKIQKHNELGVFEWARTLDTRVKRNKVEAIEAFMRRKLGEEATEEEIDAAFAEVPDAMKRVLYRALGAPPATLDQYIFESKMSIAILDQQYYHYNSVLGKQQGVATQAEADQWANHLFYNEYQRVHGEVQARLAQYDDFMGRTDPVYVRSTDPGQRTRDMLELERIPEEEVRLINISQRGAKDQAAVYYKAKQREEANAGILTDAVRAFLRRKQSSANPKPE